MTRIGDEPDFESLRARIERFDERLQAGRAKVESARSIEIKNKVHELLVMIRAFFVKLIEGVKMKATLKDMRKAFHDAVESGVLREAMAEIKKLCREGRIEEALEKLAPLKELADAYFSLRKVQGVVQDVFGTESVLPSGLDDAFEEAGGELEALRKEAWGVVESGPTSAAQVGAAYFLEASSLSKQAPKVFLREVTGLYDAVKTGGIKAYIELRKVLVGLQKAFATYPETELPAFETMRDDINRLFGAGGIHLLEGVVHEVEEEHEAYVEERFSLIGGKENLETVRRLLNQCHYATTRAQYNKLLGQLLDLMGIKPQGVDLDSYEPDRAILDHLIDSGRLHGLVGILVRLVALRNALPQDSKEKTPAGTWYDTVKQAASSWMQKLEAVAGGPDPKEAKIKLLVAVSKLREALKAREAEVENSRVGVVRSRSIALTHKSFVEGRAGGA